MADAQADCERGGNGKPCPAVLELAEVVGGLMRSQVELKETAQHQDRRLDRYSEGMQEWGTKTFAQYKEFLHGQAQFLHNQETMQQQFGELAEDVRAIGEHLGVVERKSATELEELGERTKRASLRAREAKVIVQEAVVEQKERELDKPHHKLMTKLNIEIAVTLLLTAAGAAFTVLAHHWGLF